MTTKDKIGQQGSKKSTLLRGKKQKIVIANYKTCKFIVKTVKSTLNRRIKKY